MDFETEEAPRRGKRIARDFSPEINRSNVISGLLPVEPDRGHYDTMDDMTPVPDAGYFFASLIVRGEAKYGESIIVPGEDSSTVEDSVRTKRAEVIMLGDPPEDRGRWHIRPGYHVIVPYHAGHHYRWYSKPEQGIAEHLWIIGAAEIITVFRPKTA